MLQTEKDLCQREIRPHSPENCHFSTFFRPSKFPNTLGIAQLNILFHIDNTTIAVSHGNITHIRDIENRDYLYIPVMTENVSISCDADMALWNYIPTGVSLQSNVPNPETIDVFTLQYATTYFCTNTDIYNYRVIVKSVTLKSYGELGSD